MSLNILLINHYAGSPEMGMEFRPYYFAREWVKEGHRVHIIAGDYSHLRRNNPEVKKDWQIDKIDGIYYHWVKTGSYSGNGAKRALSMERFVRKIISAKDMIIGITEPDVIICSSTYPLDTYAGQALKKRANQLREEAGKSGTVKLFHEVHDMWPSTLTEIGGMSKNNPFVVTMQAAENSAYKNSDGVISMLKYTEPYMKEHGLSEGKWHHVPLGIDPEEWKEREELNAEAKEILNKQKEKGKFLVGYFGGHALSNALDSLIDAAEIAFAGDKEIAFVLVGDGVEKKRLMEKTLDKGLTNVIFIPPIGKKKIPELCEYFDCIYMGTFKSELYMFGLSLNKMVDSMMSEKPLVCAITSPPTWAEEAGCGIIVESENPEEIYGAIETLKNMTPAERSEMGKKGSGYILQNLTLGKVAKDMLDILTEEAAKEVPQEVSE